MKNKKSPALISELNFQYDLQYDYQNNSINCTCDDYCRCSVIENFVIESVNFVGVFDTICKNYGINDKNPIETYFIDRVLTLSKSYDVDSYESDIEQGYYGQELNGIYLTNNLLETHIQYLLHNRTNITPLIEYLLVLEYENILPSLENKTFELVTVMKKDIVAPQREHLKKCDVIERYKDYKLPLGIAVLKNNEYKLVDGYHRFVSSNKDLVEIWVAK